MKLKYFLIILSLGICSCVKKNATIDIIKIGEYNALTGQESAFGTGTHQGIQLAVEEKNSAGGIKGKQIKLITYNDEGKTEGAVNAITRLITQDKVLTVIGEVASSRSIAAGVVAQRYKIPMISPSSTNPKVTEVGNFVFRATFTDPFQGKALAQFAFHNLKARNVAILRDSASDYSVGLGDYFKKEFIRLGGKIVAETAYLTGDLDFKSQVNAIKVKQPDTLFIPGYYTDAAIIGRQARELHYKGNLLGGDGWDSEKLFEIGGATIVGAHFSNQYSPFDKRPEVQEFVKKFEARWKTTPNSAAVSGYEATKLAFDAMERATEMTPAGIRDALATTKGFRTVTGAITMDEKRDPIKPLVILRVEKDGKFEPVAYVGADIEPAT